MTFTFHLSCANVDVYLQLIFIADLPKGSAKPSFESISIPLTALLSTKFEQPFLGANYLGLEIRPVPEGGLTDGTKAEIRLKDKGIFEFASSLDKTRERAIYMKRQQVEEEDSLRRSCVFLHDISF